MRLLDLRSLLPACLLVVAACGIDSQGEDDAEAPPPDISGVFQGAFVSASDSMEHVITNLAVIEVRERTYRFEFDVAPEDSNGVYDPEGYFLDTLLDAEPLEGRLDDQNSIHLSARGGDLVLNAQATRSGAQLSGDWLQVAPYEEQGTWSVIRVSSQP